MYCVKTSYSASSRSALLLRCPTLKWTDNLILSSFPHFPNPSTFFSENGNADWTSGKLCTRHLQKYTAGKIFYNPVTANQTNKIATLFCYEGFLLENFVSKRKILILSNTTQPSTKEDLERNKNEISFSVNKDVSSARSFKVQKTVA